MEEIWKKSCTTERMVESLSVLGSTTYQLVIRISLAHPQYEKDGFLRILSFSEVNNFPTLGVLSNPKADLVDGFWNGFWNGVDHP